MGIRPNRRISTPRRPPEGACLTGVRHDGVAVDLIDGTTVGYVCRHCLVKLKALNPPGYTGVPIWRPYSDDGRALPELPDPSYRTRH